MTPTANMEFNVGNSIRARLTGYSRDLWRGGGSKYFLHRHSYYELHFVTQGSCTVIIENREYRISDGNYCLLAPETYHYILSASSDCKKFCMGFELMQEREGRLEGAILAALAAAKTPIRADKIVGSELELLFQMMEENRSDYLAQEKIKAILSLFLLSVADDVCPRTGSVSGDTPDSYEYRRYVIDDYLNSHFNVQCSGVALAQELGVCDRQLNRIIQSLYGMSYREKIREIRLEVSVDLLKNTQKSVEEIADLVGYENASSFILFLKKYTGLTPKMLRQTKRSQCSASGRPGEEWAEK